jgi:prepilin-type N-terminal cleavage/methylation domain-containing protein
MVPMGKRAVRGSMRTLASSKGRGSLRRTAQRGLTLLEMIAVLAIVSLATAMVLPNWNKWLDQSVRRSDAADIVNQLRALRDRSLLLGIDFELRDTSAGSMLPDGRAALNLPQGWQVQAGSALRLSRAGVCPPGSLTLMGPGERAWLLTLEATRCVARLEPKT